MNRQLRNYDTERLSSKFLFEKHALASVPGNGTNIFYRNMIYYSKNKVPAFHRVFQMKKFLMCRLCSVLLKEFRNRLSILHRQLPTHPQTVSSSARSFLLFYPYSYEYPLHSHTARSGLQTPLWWWHRLPMPRWSAFPP